MNPTRPTGASSSSAPTTGGGAASSSAKIVAVSNSSESSETTDDTDLASLVAQASQGRGECWPEPVPSHISMGAISCQSGSSSSANEACTSAAPAQSLSLPIPGPGRDELSDLLAELCPDITPDEANAIFPADPIGRAIIVRELKQARASGDLALMLDILNITSKCGSLEQSLKEARKKTD